MAGPILSKKSDQALVEKYLSARDETSFRELYRRQTPALYALALRLCGSEADAHDAIQETWIRACSALSTFQWRSSLKTWLTGVLVNCVREQSRKHARHREEELTDDWPTEIFEPIKERLNLDQAIRRLADGYRQVLTLHDVEGYTHEEISGLLDITVGTSKSQLHHARVRLRQFLGSNQDERI